MIALFRWLDRLALLAMVVGAALLFQPWWKPGFSSGFYLLLISTVAQIITAHLPRERKAP